MYKSSNVFLDNTVVQPTAMLNVSRKNTMYFFNFDYNQMPNNLSTYSKASYSHLSTFMNI